MWGRGTEDVILVPPDKKWAFLNQDQANIRVQMDDGSSWTRPDSRDLGVLLDFLREGGTKRFMCPHAGTRVGYDDAGVYIHQDHLKRYFGVLREFASIALKTEVQEALPRTMMYDDRKDEGSTQKYLGRLVNGVGKIGAEVREEFLRAAFRGVDKDRNGVLDKEEMVYLVRRVMPTMSGKQVVDMMAQADSSRDNVVDYEEFVCWLQRHAPKEVKEHLEGHIDTEYDCVKAVFRLWDKNGDGLISKKELKTVMNRTVPEMSASQVETLCLHMDKNKDGFIDYTEFLEFLFG